MRTSLAFALSLSLLVPAAVHADEKVAKPAEDKGAAAARPAGAEAKAATGDAPAAKPPARPPKDGKGATDAGKPAAAQPEKTAEKPCEPVKPCAID